MTEINKHPEPAKRKKAIVKEFEFPVSKKKVVLYDGKGRDSMTAARMVSNDTENYSVALMSILCTFDGEKLPLEEILDLPIKDFNLLMSEAGDANFI